MNRQDILNKIEAMLKLQKGSTFEGEAEAAALLIDKLCTKYGVTLEEALEPPVLDEEYERYGRMKDAEFTLWCAVANFYDAKGYVNYDRTSGRKVSVFRCVGTEAQQIQVKLYYEFLLEVMNKECNKAYEGEKILADLLGKAFTKRGFKINFMKAFSAKVRDRLIAMKATREPHEHKEYTALVVQTMKLGVRRIKRGGYNWGAELGRDAGANVGLNKQAHGGRKQLALAGK